MTDRTRRRLTLTALLCLGAVVFLCGIDWGLPSRRGDPFLFGDHPVWSGEQIQQLAEAPGALGARSAWDDPSRPSDVARSTTSERADEQHALVVNATDSDRAQIVRRYRLYSDQPDEMLTLMALARMKPGRLDLDPRMYQYGGLWVYPVGAMLKVASLLHLVDLRSGPAGAAYYIDHPDAFGRFYIIARLYVVAWALVGVWTVFTLVRRIVGGLAIPATAAATFVLMPVVINMAHEAKPHLPGMVLVLLAVLAGARYIETGRFRAAVLTGALCGAAVGMVLSMLPALLILPMILLLRRDHWRTRLRHIALAAGAAIIVYALTNPYVIYHLFRHREILVSNIENLRHTRAIFGAGRPFDGVMNAVSLLAEGMSPVLAALGITGAGALGVRAVRMRRSREPHERQRRAVGLLLAAPAIAVALVFFPLGADKSGEFGRFLLLPDVFAIEAVVAVATFFPSAAHRRTLTALLIATTALAGAVYLRAFLRDGGPDTSRMQEARRIEALRRSGHHALAVTADPAPYGLPPVNLFEWQIVKLPSARRASDRSIVDQGPAVLVRSADVSIDPADSPFNRLATLLTSARISWADTRFDVVISEP